MKTRLGLIIGWICAALIGAFNLFAAATKFMTFAPGSAADVFSTQVGMKGLEHQLGVLEIVVVVLFLIPRTSTVGFVLMIGYMGGVLAANLTHGFVGLADTFPIYISFVLLMISAWFRNPELIARLLKRPVQVS